MIGLSALAVRASLWAPRRRWHQVEKMTMDPARAQQLALHNILHANRTGRFGVEHGFDRIADPRGLEDRVPVQTYETLRPYIEEQRTRGTKALTAEAPEFYAQTSGTTGQPKYIPITRSMLAMQRAEQRLFTYLQFKACPEAFAGKALGIMGAAVEARLDSGHAVGSVSGHLYASLPRIVRSRFVVPPEVLAIGDYQRKYLVILRLALAEPDVTYMGTPNPSTFLRLLEVLEAFRDPLLDSLESGTLDGLGETRSGDCPGSRPTLAPERRSRARAPTRTAAHLRLGLAQLAACDDMDRGKLWCRARRASRDAAGRRQGHGTGVPVERVPRHDRAHAGDTGRVTAVPSSLHGVCRARQVGPR